MKILSIDDSFVIRRIISGAVEVLEYEFLEAADGEEGLVVLEQGYQDIGLILLDWNMPGMNGLEVLKKIKSDVRFKHIPVMMVTTESEKSNITQAIQSGASNYTIKPFGMEELVKKIKECFGRGG